VKLYANPGFLPCMRTDNRNKPISDLRALYLPALR